MIFISSKVPLNEIPASKEDICKSDWFLFSSTIKNKDYQKDDELNGKYYQLLFYPYFYTQKLYNYLMSDNYYYKSRLYNTMQNSAKLTCMRKIKHYEDIVDWNEEVINKEKHIFKEDDVKKMFDTFKENNFKNNPVCEVVLEDQTINGKKYYEE